MQVARSQDPVPERLVSALRTAGVWKLEYPIAPVDGGRYTEPLMLTIWCSTTSTRRHAGAERVAQIIAPAIADWMAGSSSEGTPRHRITPARQRRAERKKAREASHVPVTLSETLRPGTNLDGSLGQGA